MAILVHGHRGARAILPENSLAGFEYAIGLGVDAIELDIAVTRDNVLVISHDPVLTHPDAVIRELTFAELNGRLPTLDEVLTLVAPSRVELNLEVKSFPEAPQYTPPVEEFVRLLLEIIDRHRMAERSMVESFDLRVPAAVKDQAPGIRRGALTEMAEHFVSFAGDVDFIAPHFRLVTPGKVDEAHAAGLQVIPWTVNAAEDWARMAEAQVDAIITDDPAALMAWLKG